MSPDGSLESPDIGGSLVCPLASDPPSGANARLTADVGVFSSRNT